VNNKSLADQHLSAPEQRAPPDIVATSHSAHTHRLEPAPAREPQARVELLVGKALREIQVVELDKVGGLGRFIQQDIGGT